MRRSGVPLFVLVTELVLSHGAAVQVTPAGNFAVAVFTMSPVAPNVALPVMLIVIDAPLANDTLFSRTLLVVPLVVPQLALALAAQLQLDTVTVSGTVSSTTTPVASLGPLLVTTIW